MNTIIYRAISAGTREFIDFWYKQYGRDDTHYCGVGISFGNETHDHALG